MDFFKPTALQLLETIDQRTAQMALDLSKLTASETKLVSDVDTLLAAAAATQKALDDLRAQTNDPAVQAALDAIAATLDAEAAKVEAADSAAPTGTTGPVSAPTGATGP